jgi:hypothetical protein
MYGLKESDPLVPAVVYNHSNSEIIYSPIDEQYRTIQQRRRWLKLGVVTILLASAVLAVSSSLYNKIQPSSSFSPITVAGVAGLPAVVQVDHLFAGLLADDEAFYFPTSASRTTPTRRHRSLRTLLWKVMLMILRRLSIGVTTDKPMLKMMQLLENTTVLRALH